MQDNFDLKGYLRKGNKLLNEGIGGYFDLMPLREEENDVTTIELDMAWDSSNPEEDKAAKEAFEKFNIDVVESGNAGTYNVTGKKEDILAYLRSEFYEMDEEAIKQYYPELLDGEMTELEKPKFVTDDSEDEKGFIVPGDEEDEQDGYRDAYDDASTAFMTAIDNLRFHDFSDEDIMDLFNAKLDSSFIGDND